MRSALTVVGYLGLCAFVLWNSCHLQGTTGQSVGRRVARTKLVKIENGQPIGSSRALLRHKIVGTVVIRVGGTAEDRSGSSPP